MKLKKMAIYSLLFVFVISFLAPVSHLGVYAENNKPQPDHKENDTLDNVLTGVKISNGIAGNMVNFSDLLLGIEEANLNGTAKPNVALSTLLLTGGFAKVIDDASGDNKKSTFVKVSGYSADMLDLVGKTADAAGAINLSFSNLSSGAVTTTPGIFSKFLSTTKAGISNVTDLFRTGTGGVGFTQSLSNTATKVKSHVGALRPLYKVLAPLAAVGAVADFAGAYSDAKNPEKDGYDVAEKIISGVSNVLVIGALLAAGTVGAPVLAVGALATGVVALGIKYRKPIGKAFKFVGTKISNGAKAAGKTFANTYKSAVKSFKQSKFGSSVIKASKTVKKAVTNPKETLSNMKKAASKTISKWKKSFSKSKVGASLIKTSKKISKVARSVKKAVTNPRETLSNMKKAASKTISKWKKSISKSKVGASLIKTSKKISKVARSVKKAVSNPKATLSTIKKASNKTLKNAKKAISKSKVGSFISKTSKKASQLVSSAKKVTKKVTKKLPSFKPKMPSFAKSIRSVSKAVKSITRKPTASKSYNSKPKTSSTFKSKAKRAYSAASKTVKKVGKRISKGFSSLFKKPRFAK